MRLSLMVRLRSIGLVSQSGARPSRPITAAAQTQQPISKYTQMKSYLSNVGANLDPQKLMSFFSEFGEIEEQPFGHDQPYPIPDPRLLDPAIQPYPR